MARLWGSEKIFGKHEARQEVHPECFVMVYAALTNMPVAEEREKFEETVDGRIDISLSGENAQS